jgi:hypothetical protein
MGTVPLLPVVSSRNVEYPKVGKAAQPVQPQVWLQTSGRSLRQLLKWY